MNGPIELRVPNIGDFKDVEVIEVLVKPGDHIAVDDPVLTLESDKATMEVPSTFDGVVQEIRVKNGDRVSEGVLILIMTAEVGARADAPAAQPAKAAAAPVTAAAVAEPVAAPQAAVDESQADLTTDVLVLGAGPGGYTAAFRAADLGLRVVLVERDATLGGVCLNVGCIPSKALLHAAKVITEAEDMSAHGVSFGQPQVDLTRLREWKDGVVSKLTKGLSSLAAQRKVTVVRGNGEFASPHTLRVETAEGPKTVRFAHAIIAAGSQPVRLPGFPNDDPRLMDSTGALRLEDIPKRLLVVGGGIIGLEMATVYDALGSRVSVVELLDGLIPGCDRDLVRPLVKRIEKRYEKIMLKTKVEAITPTAAGLEVRFSGDGQGTTDVFDRVLVAVGRRPNGKLIGAERAGVIVNERGFITVDRQMRTNVPHIFAIGDVAGEPMLAHKATHEAKIAAEVIAGHKVSFDARAIPSVAYTDPEVAWMGVSEDVAKARGMEIDKAVFPWAASGRAMGTARTEGLTKLVFDRSTGRLIGAGIVGPNAGELISEAMLALEMGAEAEDIGLTIHPHPTLAETVFFAAEMAAGTITDLFVPKK